MKQFSEGEIPAPPAAAALHFHLDQTTSLLKEDFGPPPQA